MRNMFELPRSFGVLSSPELTTRIVRTDRLRSDSRIYRTKLYKSITLFEVGYYLNISSCSQIFRVHVKYLLIPSFETHILLLIIERIRYAPYGAAQNVIPSKKQKPKEHSDPTFCSRRAGLNIYSDTAGPPKGRKTKLFIFYIISNVL